MKTTITLGDMAAKGITMLEVACRKCPRRGRLSIARLIAEHGREDYGDLRQIIAHDCPKMQNRHRTSTTAAACTSPSCRSGFKAGSILSWEKNWHSKSRGLANGI
jgi:hypothetical protein